MSSWANLHSQVGKKKESPVRVFFSNPSSDFADATLSFLYAYLYTQRSAEPFYIYDSFGYFQPFYQYSPILHYMKEAPSAGMNLYTDPAVTPLVNSLSLSTIRRSATSLLQYNGETDANVKQFLLNLGIQKQSYDVGIVLDISGCISSVLPALHTFQKRTNKKTLKVFVATDQLDLLREFAMKGDPSWSFVSLLRQTQPTDRKYFFLKTLAELEVLRSLETVAVRLGTPLGKLIYLTSKAITLESQLLSLDGKSWKALG